MTTDVRGPEQDRRPGGGEARRPGALARMLLRVLVVLLAAGAGVGGTLVCQRITAPDTGAVDAQARLLAGDLRQDLTAGFYSPGHTYGGQFTEGTLVAQVEARGGAVLSAGPAPGSGGSVHTMDVILGLVPPDEGTVAGGYPVRCYRFAFATGAYSVKESATACPATRTDGSPGSVAAQAGALLAQQPAGAPRKSATTGYAHSPRGAMDFLRDKRLVASPDAVSAVSGKATGDGVYVVALRIDAACHYLRMDSSPGASRLVPLWPAPADEQQSCSVERALASAALYGTDPAKEG